MHRLYSMNRFPKKVEPTGTKSMLEKYLILRYYIHSPNALHMMNEDNSELLIT